MAFRPFVDFQRPVDLVEDELLDVLQQNIQNVLSEAPLVLVGEKRRREEEQNEMKQGKLPAPSDSSPISKYDLYRYKYHIEHLTSALELANTQLRLQKQTILVCCSFVMFCISL